ncbi:hypothetical protein V2J09_002006 [Rumex salicifolius]
MTDDPPASTSHDISHSSPIPTTTHRGHLSPVSTTSHNAPPPPPPTVESGDHEFGIPDPVDSQPAVPEAREPWMRGGTRSDGLLPSFGMHIAKAIYELTPMEPKPVYEEPEFPLPRLPIRHRRREPDADAGGQAVEGGEADVVAEGIEGGEGGEAQVAVEGGEGDDDAATPAAQLGRTRHQVTQDLIGDDSAM